MERRQRDAGAPLRGARRLARPDQRSRGKPNRLDRVGRRRSLASRQDRGLRRGRSRGRGDGSSGTDTGRDARLVLCPYPRLLPAALEARPALRLGARPDRRVRRFSRSSGRRRRAVLRRLTHLHELPASGDVAHVGAHVLERDGGYWIVFPQEYGHYLWEVAVDAAEPFGGGPVGVDAIVGSARVKDIFFPKRLWRRHELGEALRRRHHRRRRARPRDGLLPREKPRRQERRRAREELHRRGRLRTQHDDHPLELPHRRRARSSTRRASSCTRASRRSSTSTSCSPSTGT